MSNDFSGDSRCKALWRFETLGALAVDSIGTNTLTLHNTPTCDAVNQLEGAGAMLCSIANNSGADIADASLDAGFPLKTGDVVKKITICGWFRPTSLQVSGLIGKYANASGDSFIVTQNTNSLSLGWMHSGVTWWQYIGSISSGVAYHIALIIDGVAGTAKFRIWDGSSVSNYTNNFGTTLDVGASPFLLSYLSWGVAPFGGDIDEVVVFNDLLTDAEIDKIRTGVFGNPAVWKKLAYDDDKINHSLATAANDFLVASGSGTFIKKTLAEAKTLLVVPLAASQAEQETGTETAKFVAPGTQQYHPSAAKAWGYVTYVDSTPTLRASFNVTSITDQGVGLIDFNLTVAFTNTYFSSVLNVGGPYADIVGPPTQASASVISGRVYGSDNTNYDPAAVSFAAFGDQA